jgi:hypothetical protein
MVFLQRLRNNIKYVHIIALACLTLRIITVLLKPLTTCIIFDTRIAKATQEALAAVINHLSLSIGAQGLYDYLKKDFPAIRSVSIAYKGSRVACITIKALAPFICLESLSDARWYVLTKDGILVNRDFFSLQALEGLNTVLLDTNQSGSLELYTTVASLEPEILEQYSVTWHSPTEIILKACFANQMAQLIIVASTDSIIHRERIAYAERIYKSKQHDHSKGVKGIKVDIRFRGFMVCTSLGGKGRYEKSRNE